MIYDCLPIVAVLLSEILENFLADRPLNRGARRAGTEQTVSRIIIFRVFNLDGRI
jgi:hypothetical protein